MADAVFSLELNDDQKELRKWLHEFAAEVIRPAAHEWDEREETPWPIIKEAAKAGIYSLDFMAAQWFDDTGLGMVIAQVVIVTPIILGITMSVVSTVERRVKDTVFVLGADRYQLSITVLREAAAGVLTAIMVGFGRAISEVGAVFIVGGHIEGQTQVLTTTIITDVAQAEYGHAVALGVILLLLAAVIYSLLYRIQERTLP